MKTIFWSALVVLGLVLFAGWTAGIYNLASRYQTPPEAAIELVPESEYRIVDSSTSVVLVGRTQADVAAVVSARARGLDAYAAELQDRRDRLRPVPTETPVALLGDAGEWVNIQVLEGPFRGLVGWTTRSKIRATIVIR